MRPRWKNEHEVLEAGYVMVLCYGEGCFQDHAVRKGTHRVAACRYCGSERIVVRERATPGVR